jgi:hypothetical protein
MVETPFRGCQRKPKQKEKKLNYQEIQKTNEYKNDRNCCTVVASSIVFNTPFKEMQKFFFNHMGRKRNRGIVFSALPKKVEKVANHFGYKATKLNIRDYKKSGYMTPNNCTQYLDKGSYLLGCRGHVLALKNGIVEDWTKGRKHYIQELYKIEKTGKIVKSSQNFFNQFLETL